MVHRYLLLVIVVLLLSGLLFATTSWMNFLDFGMSYRQHEFCGSSS